MISNLIQYLSNRVADYRKARLKDLEELKETQRFEEKMERKMSIIIL
jgi:hypothetical protein